MFILRILLVLVLAAGISHVSLSQPAPPEYDPLDQATRSAIIDSVAQALIDYYVFPDKGKEMATYLRRHLKKGAYDEFTDLPEFTRQLTKDIHEVTHDLHLRVYPMDPADVDLFRSRDEEPEPGLLKRDLDHLRYVNFGFEKIERLDGNVGYIKLNRFADAGVGGMTAIAAMNFVAHCKALIFDLRDNGGGEPSMIQLITSYLFEEPEHLNSFYVRDDDGDYTQQFWSHAYVQGPRLTEIPVYVLTSDDTFSGAEEFSYNLKNMKRATIVGDTTGGGAHPIKEFGFPDLLVQMRVSYGRAVNPITNTNWEGVGVLPDVPCETEKALTVAHLDALKKQREDVTDEGLLFYLDWIIAGMESELHPLSLTDAEMQVYVGDYGPRHIRIEDGKLIYQRDARDPHELIPMGVDWFRIEELDFFRMEFEMDGSGQASKIIGHYRQGHRDENERDK